MRIIGTCKHCGRQLRYRHLIGQQPGVELIHNWSYQQACGLGRNTTAELTNQT